MNYELYDTATEEVKDTRYLNDEDAKNANILFRKLKSDLRWIKERNVCVLCGGVNNATGNCDCEGFAMSDGLS